MALDTQRIIHTCTLAVRDFLRANLTNPKDAGAEGSSWIFTARHQRELAYPYVVVEAVDTPTETITDATGAVANAIITLRLRIEVWADNVKHRDQISDEIIYDLLRAGTYFTSQGMHDLSIDNTMVLDDPNDERARRRNIYVSLKVVGKCSDVLDVRVSDTHTHTRSEVTDFFSSPFWDNIPDKPSTFPSSLSQLTIDVDKDWGGRSIIGLYNVSLSGELTHAGTRTEIIGFDGSGYHWIRSVSGSDADLFMGFRRLGDGNIAIVFRAPIASRNILPKDDNYYSLGSSSLRWANIYGVNVYAGDLCFEEKECAVCGQPFEVDDEIVLKAYKIDKYTRTVPIHLKCSSAYKELEERLKLLEEKLVEVIE